MCSVTYVGAIIQVIYIMITPSLHHCTNKDTFNIKLYIYHNVTIINNYLGHFEHLVLKSTNKVNGTNPRIPSTCSLKITVHHKKIGID